MTKIYYDPFTQYENTGDLLINLSLLSHLKGYGEIVVDDRNKPKWFLDNLLKNGETKLSTYTKKSTISYLLGTLPFRIFSRKKEKIYLLLVPGDTSRKGRDKAISKFKELIKFFILKLFGCKIVRLGFSIGPFDRINLIAEKISSFSYHAYGLRDNRSMELAKRNNFKHLFFCPDFAWSYSDHLISRNDRESTRPFIIFSFRSNAYGTVHDESFLVPILKNLEAILSLEDTKNYQIKVTYQVQYDRDACMQICSYLEKKYDVEFVDKKLLLADCLSLYKEAEFIISNRLHVLLAGVLTGTLSIPLINLDQNKKIVSIYEDNNLSALLLDYNGDLQVNLEKMLKAIEESDEWNDKLINISKVNREKTKKIITTVFN